MIYTPNAPTKLEAVSAEMEVLGSPSIRAWWSGEAWYAIEGSNRVAAAHSLGLTVDIIEVFGDDSITDHDIQDLPDSTTVSDILQFIDWSVAAYDCEIV